MTTTPSDANRTLVLDQRMRADDQRQLAAAELGEQVRAPGAGRGAGQKAGANRLGAEQPPAASRSAARRASRSAPSAPPDARARPHAASRKGPLPSCPSQPRPSAGAASARPAQVLVDRSQSGSLVAGERKRQAASKPAGDQSAGLADTHRRRAAAAPAAAHEQRELAEQQLLERQPAPRQLLVGRAVGKCAARSAAPRSARRSRARSAAGNGSGTSSNAWAWRAHERQDLSRGQAVGGRVVGDRAGPGQRIPRVRVRLYGEAPAGLELSMQDQPRSRRVALTSHGWLKKLTLR